MSIRKAIRQRVSKKTNQEKNMEPLKMNNLLELIVERVSNQILEQLSNTTAIDKIVDAAVFKMAGENRAETPANESDIFDNIKLLKMRDVETALNISPPTLRKLIRA